jgi:type IV pilus assembly protein PilY1
MKASAPMRCTQELFAWLIAIVLCAGAALPSEARAQEDLRGILPFIMLVIDTSASMERLPTCACTTPSCEECVPQCGLANLSGGVPPEEKKNRWALTLEALTGTFNNFECESIARTSTNNMTYDLGFHMPYFQPWDCDTQSPGTRCAFDSDNSTRDQRADGILDLNESAIRFGLMTFDGLDTMVGYPPLVSVTDFTNNLALSEAVQGLWSYGGAERFHYPNCTTSYMMDTGARSPIAPEGGLVSLESCTGGGTPGSSATCPAWCSTCFGTSQTVNRDIQEALLATRPFGGTPIAASLTDLYYHFENDVDDDFGACRDRFALLITDGYPDDDYRSFGCNCLNDGTDCGPGDTTAMRCPYPTAEDAARKLVSGAGTADPPVIERLYVLGLAVEDAVVVDRLNAIANNGCKELDAICTEGHPGGDHALFADNLSTLQSAVQDIVNENNRPISRTIPVFAASQDPTTPQYQFSSGLTLPTQSGEPRRGVLERRRFVCGGTTPGYQNINQSSGDIFDANLDQQGTRRLFTALPSGTTPVVTEALISGPNPERWDPAATACTSACSMPELDTVDIALLGAAGTADGQAIKDWMYARPNTPRDNAALGAIFHSTPVVVSPPQLDTSDDAFNAWRRSNPIALRPQVLYVGTNDGVLHAFATGAYDAPDPAPDSTGTWRNLNDGEELWGFVPPMVLPNLGTNRTNDQTLMDGTPVVRNVYTDRMHLGTTGGYKSILVSGMRHGGRGYVALDVTNPFDPKFLWQVTDDQMGQTYGQAAIVQASFRRPIRGENRVVQGAIAILPGGIGSVTSDGDADAFGCNGATAPQMRQSGSLVYTTQTDPIGATTSLPHRTDVRCWEPTGRALYIVDVADGYLIKKISLPDDGRIPAADNVPIFPSPMVSTPAAFPDDTGVEATRAFITDADGVIWRLDLSADDPEPLDPEAGWTARPFHDMFHATAEPSTPAAPFIGELTYEAPILSTDIDGRTVVIVGTGDNGDFMKPAVRNRVASLTEIEVLGVPLNSIGRYKAAFNWEMLQKNTSHTTELNDGTVTQVDGFSQSELVTGPMVLFEGQLFFSTFIAVTDPDDVCAFGRGRVHAVSYNLRDTNDRNPSGTNGPLRINAGTNSANNIVNILRTNTAGDNVMIMGLTLTQQPSCRQADLTYEDPWGSSWSSVSSTGAPPPMYLAAHAAFDNHGSSLVDDIGGSRVFSAEVQINRPPHLTTVLSWATSTE